MKGKVLQKTGVTWIRYRVLFENGVEVGLLDGRHLVKLKGFIPIDQRVAVDRGDGATDAAPSGRRRRRGGRRRQRVRRAGHLLERAKKARERLGA